MVYPAVFPTAPQRYLDMAVFIVNERSELVAFTESQLGMVSGIHEIALSTNVVQWFSALKFNMCFPLIWQKFCVQCHLKRGAYDLLTFSSGCRLTGQTRLSRSPREVKLVSGTGDEMRLTRQFRYTCCMFTSVERYLCLCMYE